MFRHVTRSIGLVSPMRSTAPVMHHLATTPTLQTRFQSTVKPQAPVWIQNLLDEHEGKGYLLADAGLPSQGVSWGEIDSFQHVNNKVYLAWFETARVNMFLKWGTDFQRFMSGQSIAPVMRSVNLAWRFPIKFPDQVTVVHKIDQILDDRFILKGVVVGHKSKKVCARIEEVIVAVDYTKGATKCSIPDDMREFLERKKREQGAGEYDAQI
ncbi:hypothetical protein CJU90_2592 [Yarrowia sp. C11]|nr:hypothetical protein CKK34_4040 [Yarrowia sp. E02]KAG5369145.1 hypothetical protein CJU90_2592 [Yarrowia sp. C11]